MSIRLSRRDVLRLAGISPLAIAQARLIAGCSSDSSNGAATVGGDAGADAGPLPPLEFDPASPWWMQHNFGPVGEERDATALEVEGTIPPELDGLYVRNGSNPNHGDPGHWFLGQGMVHGVRLQGGKALWYKNRYVRTPLLDRVASADAGVGPPTLPDTASNVSLLWHANKLLSLGEVGFPYQLSPEDLSTLGLYDFGGKLTTSMTAHPKVDPVTSELLMFAYWFSAPYLTYHRVDASGALTRSEPITLPRSVMMHDFQVTETRVVFMDLPIVFDLAMAIAGSPFPFKWDGSNGARLGIMPRDGGDADVKWVEIDTCFVFHTLNAYDDADGKVVLEACRFPELWVNGPDDFDAFPTLHRFTIDAAAGTASLSQVDDRMMEFPNIDRRRAGRKHRYGYGLWLRDAEGTGHPNGARGVLKYDRDGGTSTVHAVDAATYLDETIFVPAAADAGEDDGFLLTFGWDRRTDRSALYILDASRMDAKPIAKIQLPYRVPFGFHGVWVPA